LDSKTDARLPDSKRLPAWCPVLRARTLMPMLVVMSSFHVVALNLNMQFKREKRDR
jgi:hypothetical protein